MQLWYVQIPHREVIIYNHEVLKYINSIGDNAKRMQKSQVISDVMFWGYIITVVNGGNYGRNCTFISKCICYVKNTTSKSIFMERRKGKKSSNKRALVRECLYQYWDCAGI